MEVPLRSMPITTKVFCDTVSDAGLSVMQPVFSMGGSLYGLVLFVTAIAASHAWIANGDAFSRRYGKKGVLGVPGRYAAVYGASKLILFGRLGRAGRIERAG